MPLPPDLRRDDIGDDSDISPLDWRDNPETTQLDVHEDHDIWIFERPQTVEEKERHEYTPATFGDLNPNPDGPDPEVWPLEPWDPGAPAPIEDLNLVNRPFPEPHVAWLTDEWFEKHDGHYSLRVELGYRDLAPWERPDGMKQGDTITVVGGKSRMELTEERMIALDRLARLWNGEVVRGTHLLWDKCPTWRDIFGDLDDDELRRLWSDPNTDDGVVEAFSDHRWFEEDASVFLKPKWILRKKVWYAPMLSGKTLINGRDDLPDLRGDPFEGLRHRVTVGLVALYCAIRGRDVYTYQRAGDFINAPNDTVADSNVDVVALDQNGDLEFTEVLTGHKGWENHRNTYDKLVALSQHGTSYVAFDSRETARTVINLWLNSGLAEFPTGTFDSAPRLDWIRDKMEEASSDWDVQWHVENMGTTDWYWRKTLGRDARRDLTADVVTSLDW